MKRKRFNEEQIVGILKEHEAGISVSELCRKHGVSDASIYRRKAKCGGLEVSEARRLKALEDENGKLKKLLEEDILDNAMLKDIASKNGDARCRTVSGGSFCAGALSESTAGVRSCRMLPDDSALSISPTWRCELA